MIVSSLAKWCFQLMFDLVKDFDGFLSSKVWMLDRVRLHTVLTLEGGQVLVELFLRLPCLKVANLCRCQMLCYVWWTDNYLASYLRVPWYITDPPVFVMHYRCWPPRTCETCPTIWFVGHSSLLIFPGYDPVLRHNWRELLPNSPFMTTIIMQWE